MPNELHLMTMVAVLDAVHTDGVTFRRVASSAAVEVVHGKTSVA